MRIAPSEAPRSHMSHVQQPGQPFAHQLDKWILASSSFRPIGMRNSACGRGTTLGMPESLERLFYEASNGYCNN